MISEEDIHRIREAKNCDGCIGWHKYCNSECCKISFLNVPVESLKSKTLFVDIKIKNLSFSDIRYYSLRGVRYTRGVLRFHKKHLMAIGRKVVYVRDCDWLENNLCKGHPDKKPDLCKMLNLENSKKLIKPFAVTDNCLFKYKNVEGIEE